MVSYNTLNSNSNTYYDTCTTTSGSSAIDPAKLPGFDSAERFEIVNYDTFIIVIKTGGSAVTVNFPTSADTASSMTMIGPGQAKEVHKEKSHTTFAIEGTGSARYSVQYGAKG